MSTQTLTRPKQHQTVEKKVQQLRQLYADGPQYAKTALENTLAELTSPQGSKPGSRIESAGRTGIRQGKVSELTLIAPLAPATTCVSCSWTTTRSCSSRPPMTAIGIPISMTSRRR